MSATGFGFYTDAIQTVTIVESKTMKNYQA